MPIFLSEASPELYVQLPCVARYMTARVEYKLGVGHRIRPLNVAIELDVCGTPPRVLIASVVV